MPTKVFDIELSDELKPVWGTEKYDRLWILMRCRGQPFGWISVSNGHRQPVISTEQLSQTIAEQAGWPLALSLLRDQASMGTKELFGSDPISIVVCSRDRADLLDGCLSALLSLDYPCYEIIVVDNAPSTDETANLAARLPIRYVREDRPGLDWARNRGIAEARYDIIAFTDDDARPDSQWLRAIACAFRQQEVMAVTGLVAPAELETAPQHVFEFGYGGMGKGMKRRIFRIDEVPLRDLLWAHVFGVGANMAFRRTLFDAIGTFDVALDVGTPSGSGGDLDMLHRLVCKGHTLVYEPAAIVWHIHRRSASVLRRQLYDNGRGFGSYLLTCLRNRTVSRLSLLRFAAKDWLRWWFLRRLCRPRGFPRHLILAEFFGALRSPIAYWAAQVHARRIANTFSRTIKNP